MDMGKPIWTTKAGNLGTIQEQTFYQLVMEAYDPDGGDLSYKIVAGQLPPGLVMYENGTLQGQPKELYYIRGVPFDVKEDVTSTFCCRATSVSTGQVTDRTFSITVTGEDPPVITTPDQQLARVLDGTYLSIQLEAVDLDSEPISWAISKGQLPKGLTLDPDTGIISGYVYPEANLVLSVYEGWSSEASWEQYPWDYDSIAVSKSYQFEVQATDGKTYDGARYTIYVIAHDSLLADNGAITADEEETVSADNDNKHNPVLITKPADLGTYTHDNYFAFKFEAKDFDDDVISYSLLLAEGVGYDNEVNGFDSTLLDPSEMMLPPGLTLQTDTGWLYGQIPGSQPGQTDYLFAVKVYKRDYTEYQSQLVFFTMTIVNDLKRAITWNTPTDLGTIESGSISEKYVLASNQMGRNLNYSLVFQDGAKTKLPQGLKLNPDGLIVGRPSFELTSLDGGTTTFDQNVRTLGFITKPTTFDRVYTFKVLASDADGDLMSYRTFTLKVVPSTFGPYESLYLRAQPGLDDKEVISQIINNSDVFPPGVLYRSSDPYFGKSRDVRMLLLSGLVASTSNEYLIAMATNHYRKVLRFGDFKTARALNDDGTLAYEVVYAEMIDDLVSNDGKTVPSVINLTSKIKKETYVDSQSITMDNELYTLDGAGDKIVYPNSLQNMRSKLINQLGLAQKQPLPRWMTSKQSDGRIIGWIPAVVFAYVKPGEGNKVMFNLDRLAADPKVISFDVDRYILDNNMSRNYNTTTNSYNESQITSFDKLISPLQDPVGTADFAVSIPFDRIDGMTSAFVDSLGGFDGIIDVYDGKKIVFALQENYPGYILQNDGWQRNLNSWDDDIGWDDPTNGFDHYELIPGYLEALDDSTQNQRSAIWLITEDAEGILRLTVDTYVDTGDTVNVTYGSTYGGFVMRYGPNPLFSEGDTVPRYKKYQPLDFAAETTFDNLQTRFVSEISVYQDPDEGDKYLAFPRVNIWA